MKCRRQKANLDQGAKLNPPAQIPNRVIDPVLADKPRTQPAATSATHEVRSLMPWLFGAGRLVEAPMPAKNEDHSLQRRNATADTPKPNAVFSRCPRNPAATLKSFVSINTHAKTEKSKALKAKFAAVGFGPPLSAFIISPFVVLYRIDAQTCFPVGQFAAPRTLPQVKHCHHLTSVKDRYFVTE
jgi:hypothetical protein